MLNEESLTDSLKRRLKDLKRRKNIKNYYLKKIKGGKSYNAVLLDSLIIKFIMTLLFFIVLISKTGHFILSLIISLLFLFSVLYASYYIKAKKFNKKVIEINKDIVNRKIMKEINYFTNDEFIQYVREIFEKYYNISFDEYKENIDLVGKKYDEVWAIKCFKTSQEDRISKKDIRDFKDEVDEIGIERGIVVTNSYFVSGMKTEYEGIIELVDFDSLVYMVKEIGEYPSKEDVEEIIISRYEENKKDISKRKGHVFSKTKVFKYLFLSFCLFILSTMTIYSFYYMIMAFISLSLAIVSVFYEYFQKLIFKETEEE